MSKGQQYICRLYYRDSNQVNDNILYLPYTLNVLSCVLIIHCFISIMMEPEAGNVLRPGWKLITWNLVVEERPQAPILKF